MSRQRKCRCGCGRPVKLKYWQGHDAIHVAAMVRRYRQALNEPARRDADRVAYTALSPALYAQFLERIASK